jgi:hypothetical protein
MICSRFTLPLPSFIHLYPFSLSLSLTLPPLLSSSHSLPYFIATGPGYPDQPILGFVLFPFIVCYWVFGFPFLGIGMLFGTIVLFSIYVLSFGILFRFQIFGDCCYCFRNMCTCGMYDICCDAGCEDCAGAGVNSDGSARYGGRWNVN